MIDYLEARACGAKRGGKKKHEKVVGSGTYGVAFRMIVQA